MVLAGLSPSPSVQKDVQDDIQDDAQDASRNATPALGNQTDQLTPLLGSDDDDFKTRRLEIWNQVCGWNTREFAIARDNQIGVEPYRIDFCL